MWRALLGAGVVATQGCLHVRQVGTSPAGVLLRVDDTDALILNAKEGSRFLANVEAPSMGEGGEFWTPAVQDVTQLEDDLHRRWSEMQARSPIQRPRSKYVASYLGVGRRSILMEFVCSELRPQPPVTTLRGRMFDTAGCWMSTLYDVNARTFCCFECDCAIAGAPGGLSTSGAHRLCSL